MALTNSQKQAIAERAYEDVKAGRPSPFKCNASRAHNPQPPPPKK